MGSAWPGANFQLIDQNTEIVPGMYLIALVSDKPGTMELKGLSLAIKSSHGAILIVGCSHPGVEHIMQEAAVIDPHINIGGLHEIQAPDPEVERIADVLHDQYKVERVAPGHCTGEPEFAALKRVFGDHYVYAGVGSVRLNSLKEMVGERGFEPPTPWSRTIKVKIPSASHGVA